MNHGFTLVELAIVLVILGLLVGGTLTGQSLIRAAELRSITTEFNQYQTAVRSFRDRYFALPGDMTNATKFWGAAHADPATCETTASTGSETCNGDGDGLVGDNSSEYYERFRFWHHLANAELIEGRYTGIAGDGSAWEALIGTNVPPSKLSRAGWATKSRGTAGGASFFGGNIEGLHYMLGGELSGLNPHAPVLKPEEAWNIDKKMDDGLPGQGRIHGFKKTAGFPDCSTSDDPSIAEYNLGDEAIRCPLLFFTGI